MNTFAQLPSDLRITRMVPIVSDRQRVVWKLIAEGQYPKEIAAQLGLSVKTVDCHGAALRQRLGARNAADLTRAAIRFGVIAVEVLPHE